ncbi:hypothetical protein K2Z84_05130 [Candidatus Binatia bacterium]|nr:hypothetical protein [Candidatus Binatia bacterium]
MTGGRVPARGTDHEDRSERHNLLQELERLIELRQRLGVSARQQAEDVMAVLRRRGVA